MRVLITGGCGFLGSNIAASYLDRSDDVVVIDTLSREGGASNLEWLVTKAVRSKLTHYEVDVADVVSLKGVFNREEPFDYVCHLSGQVAMTTSLIDPRRDFETNVLGTFNVLEAVRAHSPDAFLAYSSTNKVYGDLLQLRYGETYTRYTVPFFPMGFDETLPLDFASPYGCSKGAADQYVRDWYRNYGLKTVVFRHSSIYGGRQFSTVDQGWIGWFCRNALMQRAAQKEGKRPQPFSIAGTGKQVRDVLHADDLVRLYHAAYEQREKVAGQVFNVGGGTANSLSLIELFGHLAKILRLDGLSFAQGPTRKSDQKVFIADIRKVSEALEWTPMVSLNDGLMQMLSWVCTQSEAGVKLC